ncbi:MAG: CsbD family protein [Phycisphaerales bacterium]
MANHKMQGQWKQVRGKVKEKWGALTDDDLDQIDGKQDQLVGKIQERYGRRREEAEKEVSQFFDRLTT